MARRIRSVGVVVGAMAFLEVSWTLAAQERILPTHLASGDAVEIRGRNQDDPKEVRYRAESEDRLAKQLQNPVADLFSVPLESNWDGDLGPDQAGFRYTMNVRPVIPIDLSDDWMLITRTVLPIVYQFDVFGDGTGRAFGLGDTLQSFFLSPKESGGVTWGFGPAFLWPTATRDVLGGGKWAVGPTGVLLVQEGAWTVGVEANHLWSYEGSESRADANQTSLRPFLAITFPKGTTLSLNTEATYDWHSDQWTVPVIAGISQVLKVGTQPISLGVQGKYWVEGPSTAPDWGVRFDVTFIFPH